MRSAAALAGRRHRALPEIERRPGTGPAPRKRRRLHTQPSAGRRLAISQIARLLRSQAEHAVPFLGKDIAVCRVVVPVGGVEQLEITPPHPGRPWRRFDIAQSTNSLAASGCGALLTAPTIRGVAGNPSAGATNSTLAPLSLKRM